MQQNNIGINTPYISMDKLLKLANIASSGGEAHILISEGYVQLNGSIIHEKRKKVYPGNIVIVDNKYTITVFEENEDQ